MEDVGLLVYFTAIWYILLHCGKSLWQCGKCLWQCGTFCGNLVYIFPILVCFTKKNLAALFL
jgi:hypothetical protein